MTQVDSNESTGANLFSTTETGPTSSSTESHPAQPVDPTMIRNLIRSMAEALVDHPGQVTVEAIAEPTGTLIRLCVAAEDIGKVIGKQGRTARSIRTILSAASMKNHHRFALDILEEPAAPQS